MGLTAKETSEFQKLLKHGHVFLCTKFACSNKESAGKRDLFIEKNDETQAYSLYWSKQGKGYLGGDQSRSILLDRNTSVFTGKKTEVFRRNKFAKAADTACCMSVVSSKRSLDLDCGSSRVRDLLVASLLQMIQSSCKEDKDTPSSMLRYTRPALNGAGARPSYSVSVAAPRVSSLKYAPPPTINGAPPPLPPKKQTLS